MCVKEVLLLKPALKIVTDVCSCFYIILVCFNEHTFLFKVTGTVEMLRENPSFPINHRACMQNRQTSHTGVLTFKLVGKKTQNIQDQVME